MAPFLDLRCGSQARGTSEPIPDADYSAVSPWSPMGRLEAHQERLASSEPGNLVMAAKVPSAVGGMRFRTEQPNVREVRPSGRL